MKKLFQTMSENKKIIYWILAMLIFSLFLLYNGLDSLPIILGYLIGLTTILTSPINKQFKNNE